MTRPPVTIALVAWNSWAATETCLDSVRPTMGLRDQLVVVDNGSTDETAAALRLYPWAEVVSNTENRGFAGGCNDALGRARHDIVVFLHNDTAVTDRWIDPLAAALAEPSVVAAGPRSDRAPADQRVADPAFSSPAEMRHFAREWARDHRGMLSYTAALGGFCLAVRRDALEALGGFDEGFGLSSFEAEDLCLRLGARGGRLAVCHESFVHHGSFVHHKHHDHQHGARTALGGRLSQGVFDANGVDRLAQREAFARRLRARHPGAADAVLPVLVSGCIIVKDEEERLGECLSSLAGVADEIVVYDTGSTDATVELARSLGARVIEGYWDDDFSRARNAALEHCRGEWIAWLDADETLQADDLAALRSTLTATSSAIDAYSVLIQNLTGTGAGSELTHHAARLFRRDRCEWTGRLHEQVARRGDHGAISQADLGDSAWIRHTGYLLETMVGRNKAERNLRVAQAEVDHADGWDRGYSLTSLGRSLLLAGRPADALERVTEALDHTANPITRRLAVRTAVDCLLALGRPGEALTWCERLRSEGADPNTADAFEATVRLAREEWETALRLLVGLHTGTSDADGFGVAAGMVAAQKAQALAALGRVGEAADSLLAALSEEGVLDTHLGALVDYMRRSGRPLASLAEVMPGDRSLLFMAQVLQLQPEAADAVLEACFAARSGGAPPQTVLAAASKLAVQLPIERALVWSSRLRQAGQAQACPLVAMAASADGPPVERARAAAVALGAFADSRGEDLFWQVFHAAPAAEREQMAAEASQLCPGLLLAGRAATGP
jgi:GT2 family glycosyltransferase